MDKTGEKTSWRLIQAASGGDLEGVRRLLAQGVEVDATDFQGCTALTFAAGKGYLQVVEELLHAGADPDHRDNDTETVLMWAADHPGNAAVLRALIAAGANVNLQNDMQQTALGWTMRHGDPDMVRALLEAGAGIRPDDLSLAVHLGLAHAVRLLLEYGADTRGQADLEVAKNRGHREVTNLLRQAMTGQKLQDAEASFPFPRYPIGTRVRTLTGTPCEGRVVSMEWYHKRGRYRYGYYIEVEGEAQIRETEPQRYWEEELQAIADESTAL